MRVLAFRHVPFEGLGLLEDVLRARGVAFEYVDSWQAGSAIPDAASASGLIFLGGPMSVNDDLVHLGREMAVIRAAAARRQPVLGICLGAQLIAKALGATVSRNPQKEIGWFEVEFAAAAASDALFSGLSRETVFHWHGETFALPSGAELLASSTRCTNQLFRAENNIYGMQFHLEVTPEIIASWCVQDENCGDLPEIIDPIDSAANAKRVSQLADIVFGKWVGLLPSAE